MVKGLQCRPYLNRSFGTVVHSLPNDQYVVQLRSPWTDPASGTIKEEPISLKGMNLVDASGTIEQQAILSRRYICRVCSKEVARDDIKKCAKCKRAFYCSKKCQFLDWSLDNHKEECKVLRKSRKEKDPELPSIHGTQDRYRARVSRAFRFLQIGDGPSAEDEFRRIIVEFDKNEHWCPYNHLAYALTLQCRFDDAMAALQQAVELPLSDGENPDNRATSYAMIGTLFRRKNDPHRAREALQKALAIDPNHQMARETMYSLDKDSSRRLRRR